MLIRYGFYPIYCPHSVVWKTCPNHYTWSSVLYGLRSESWLILYFRWSSYIRTRSFSTIQHNSSLIRPQNISPFTDWRVKGCCAKSIRFRSTCFDDNSGTFRGLQTLRLLSLHRLRTVLTLASIWSSFLRNVAGLSGSFSLSWTNLFTNKLDMAGFLPRVSIFVFLYIQERSESFYWNSWVFFLFQHMFCLLSTFF